MRLVKTKGSGRSPDTNAEHTNGASQERPVDNDIKETL